MPLWQRLLITLAAMLLASYLVGLLWHWMFTAEMPSYLSGAVGGITAVPIGSSCEGSVPSTRAEPIFASGASRGQRSPTDRRFADRRAMLEAALTAIRVGARL